MFYLPPIILRHNGVCVYKKICVMTPISVALRTDMHAEIVANLGWALRSHHGTMDASDAQLGRNLRESARDGGASQCPLSLSLTFKFVPSSTCGHRAAFYKSPLCPCLFIRESLILRNVIRSAYTRLSGCRH